MNENVLHDMTREMNPEMRALRENEIKEFLEMSKDDIRVRYDEDTEVVHVSVRVSLTTWLQLRDHGLFQTLGDGVASALSAKSEEMFPPLVAHLRRPRA